MAGMRRRYDLEKLISESNIPVLQQLPDDINVNQLKWGLRSKLESLNAITPEGQEIASVDNYPMIKEQIQRLESLLDQEILSLKNEILKIYQLQAGQKSEWSMIEVEQQKKQEEREVQLTEELQNKWQDVLEKINNVPQAIEEQLQLQQSVFIQEISGIISELAVLRQDKEHWEKKQEERESQLTKELQDKWQEVLGKMDAFPQGIEEQLQQSLFMQEISTIISKLVVLQQDKEQGEKEQIAGKNMEWSVVEEIRHLMGEMKAHMLEEGERQEKQEEREAQLTKELQNKWQDVLGKIDAFPQGIEEQLQLQQSVFMQEISRIISELTVLQQDKEQREREQTAGNNVEWNVTEEIRHLMDEMEFFMLEEAERQKKQEERESQLTKELQNKWQDVLGKIDTFPQGIEEQLQQQQSVFMQEFSRIISELTVLQQDKEQREREQTVTGNTGWNVAEEVRHLIDEMGVHMLEEAERQKKQEEREAQLTKELQDKWQDVLGKIDAFPQGIEEQLQLQQSVFMQEISRIISELTVLQQDKEQGGKEQAAGKNMEWNVAEEIRHLMDEMKDHMLEESERQKKQEERKSQLTNELQNKWQDVLGKIDGFPQAIEEQLQLQQSVFMQEVSGKIDAFPQAIEEKLQQSVFIQDVLGKIDGFPQTIEEQLQLQQSEFMQEISRIISELTVLQQDKEQGGKEQTAGKNMEWNVAEEIRHLMDEMKDHMLEESERQKKQEERKSQLTNELQNKWQDVLGKIDGFPQAIEEQLQLQQSVFMQEVSGKIDAFPQAIEEQLQQQQSVFMQDVLGKIDDFPQAIEEQLQLQQSVFMQEVSGKIDALPQAIEEQLQLQQSVFMQDVLGKIDAFPQGIEEQLQLQQSVFMQDISGKIDAFPQAIEEQLQQQQSVFMQDISGKIDAFPQAIEEQLQLQQSVFMQEISRIISELTVLQQDKEQREREQTAGNNAEWNVTKEIRHLMDEMEFYMLEESERQKKQEEREAQLTKELQDKWQDVLGKIDAFPQGIEEQLQLQQSVFMQEISRIISELTVLQEDKEQREKEQTAEKNLEWNVAEEIRHLMDEMKAHMFEEGERQKKQEERESQLTKELQNKWQDVLGKIDAFPQGIEEQLQQQQSIFMPEISTIISELAVLRQDKEQLQLQQSVFMQEISRIISELTVLQQEKEQREKEQTAEKNLEWSVAEEIRHLMGEMKAHMLEESERQKKQEECESQLTKELQDKWQDVLGKVGAFPQGIEEQLQLQQDKEQREREQIAAEIRHLMGEMKAHMLEESERQKKQEERESQLTKELQDKRQGVLGKLEAFPQGIEEQLQLQQSIFMPEISTIISELAVLRQDKEQLQLQQSEFMQEISRIISELTVLQQDKEQGEKEQIAGKNLEWSVVEEIRHLMGEMKAHMFEEGERQKKQEERESQLTKELQDKWQDVLGKLDAFPQGIEEQLQLQQDKEQREREQIAAEIRHLMDEMKAHMLEEGERQEKQEEREAQVTKELQDKWQDVLGKIDAFPQGIEERLQLQQSVIMQDVSGKIDAFPQAIEEQLQQQQSVIMQEVSRIISELAVLQQDKEQGEKEQTTGKNLEWNVAEEIHHLMDEMKAHMLEEGERQEKQEEREAQVTKELQDKWQDVLGKIDAFPQGIEERLQLQQSVFMQDVSGKIDAFPQAIEEQLQQQQSVIMQEVSRIISELAVLQQDKEQGEKEQTAGKNLEWNVAEEIRHLKDEMKAHMLEEGERQRKQEERESQLANELQNKWQDVLGKIDAFPQGIEEQLQLQQSIFMQEISRIISELTVLQQDKERWEREEKVGDNMEWNVEEEVRHLKDEMGAIRHMLEEVAEYSRRLTEISQQKDLISGEVSLLKAELIALRKTQEQANEQIEQQHSIEESVVCPQMIKAQLQQGNMLNHEILSLKEELAFIRELYENRLKRKKRRH